MDEVLRSKVGIGDPLTAVDHYAPDCAALIVSTVPADVPDAQAAAIVKAMRRLLKGECILWLKLPRESMAEAIGLDHWVQLESRPQHFIYQFAMSSHCELTKEQRRALNEALIQAKHSSQPEPFPMAAIDVIIQAHTVEGDTVLDPFARTGAVGAMANWMGRHSIQIVPNKDVATTVHDRAQKAIKARRERQAAAKAAAPAEESNEPAPTEEPAPPSAPFVPLATRRRVRAPEAMPAAFVPPPPPPDEEPFAAPSGLTYGDLHGHPGCHGCQICWGDDPAVQAALEDPDLGKGDPQVDPEATGAQQAYTGNGWAVLQGDTLRTLPCFPDGCFDACVTDPPYGLSEEPDAAEVLSHWLRGDRYHHGKGGFMGKSWDSFVPGPEYWREVYRVLKPGAYLLAMSSSRTWDLLSVAIRLAGFESRDTIAVHGVPAISWTYGQGFPKSLDVAKAVAKQAGGASWAGWGTALKPAHEVVLVFRKPMIGTVAANVLAHRTGALNIDACRIEGAGAVRQINTNPGMKGGQYGADAYTPNSHSMRETTEGRWPSNVVLCHAPDCVLVGTKKVKGAAHYAGDGTGAGKRPGGFMDVGAEAGDGLPNGRSYTDDAGMETVEDWKCAPGCAVAEMDAQSGIRKSGGPGAVRATAGAHQGNCYGVFEREEGQPLLVYADEGGASRFFPTLAWEPGEIDHAFRFVSKASKRERNQGCETLDEQPRDAEYRPKTGNAFVDRVHGHFRARNPHPTVKPVALMRWLVRLVTPPGGMVLDPFCGSGTTGMAAVREGAQFTGVELDTTFADIAQRRVGSAIDEAAKTTAEAVQQEAV